MYILEKIKQELFIALQVAISKNIDISGISFEYPSRKELGDLAFPCFQLSGKIKTPPHEIAQKLEKALKAQMPVISKKALIQKISSAGGYVNFTFRKNEMAKKVLDAIEKEGQNYGKSEEGKGKKVMIEYVSPNTNKPLHLGHLRNAFLSWSLIKLYENAGYRVIKTQVVNNIGIHIAKSMLAYQKWSGEKGLEKKPSKDIKGDHLVGKYYVKYSQEEKNNPDLINEAKGVLQKWERGDKKISRLGEKMNKWALEGINATYKKIRIDFDKIYYQNEYFKEGRDIVEEGLGKRRFGKKNGAVFADLQKYNLPERILMRSDGTTLYITQDLHLARTKFKDYELDKSLVVTGSEQDLHFKQLLAILDILDYPWAKDYAHISHGMVFLPEGKMKSREGTVVDADDILRELEVIVKEEVRKRGEKIDERELGKRASIIALAALKFFMLIFEPKKDIHYVPKESISFTGKTGPYLLYTYARINNILKKSGFMSGRKIDCSVLSSAVEGEMIFELAKFPEVSKQALHRTDPSIMAKHLFELCQKFNDFYHQLPVLQADKKERLARLYLLKNIQKILGKGFELLGILPVERM